MKQDSSLKFSFEASAWRRRLCTGGLLLCLMSLSLTVAHLLERGVNASGQERPAGKKDATQAIFSTPGSTIAPASPSAPAAVYTVNSLGDAGAGTGTTGDLRYCLTQANAAGGTNVINFTVTGTIDLTASLPSINNHLTLNGPGAGSLTVRAANAGYRIFTVTGAWMVSIAGLTISDAQPPSDGGGIFTSGGTLSLINCVVRDNTAAGGNGGGIYSLNGSLLIAGSTIAGNQAFGLGGGIRMALGTTLTLIDSTISGNTAGSGGGLSADNMAATLSNCTISGNTATSQGGGALLKILTSPPALTTFSNCTISDNASPNGAGVSLISGVFTGVVRLKNSIVAGNFGANFSPNPNGAVATLGHNLDSDGSSGFPNGVNGDKVGTVAAPIDAKLCPLTYNGGLPRTHALLASSPAIDAGDNSGAPANDQRGFARPADGDGNGVAQADIGAYELRPKFVNVATGNDGNSGATPGAALKTIGKAILAASAGDALLIAAGAYPETNLVINKPLGLYGAGAAVTILDGTLSGPILEFSGGHAGVLYGLTVTKAKFGSAINNVASVASIINCAVTGNEGQFAGNVGGGIRSADGILTVIGSSISNNQENNGGGIAVFGTLLTMIDCTISGNEGGLGGGLRLKDSAATLTNCTISGNLSGTGAGIDNQGSTLTMNSCTVSGNTGSHSTIRSVLGGTAILKNTLVAGNSGPNFHGAAISLGNNLDSDGTSGLAGGVNGDLVGTAASKIDALLAPLAGNGGLTQTHALLPGSPAINAGTNSGTAAADQRGVGRVGAPDIGAFESRGFTLVASGGNNQFAQVGNVFATPLRAIVSSNFAEPVSGGAVAFSAPSSGASAAFSPNQVTIGANHQAVATATANGQAGSYQVTATANGGNAANFTLTNVQCQTISISPANLILPAGTAGQPYSQPFTQTGGAGAITWSVGISSLPDGLTLNPVSGVLSGTPTVFGSFVISILATDAAGCTGTRAYGLTINAPACAVVVNPAALPDGALGAAYNTTVSASGGTASYTFGVSVGALPGGVSLSNAGALTGTPNALGIFHFTIQATDANGCQGMRTYTVTINAGAANNGLQFYPLAAPVRLLDTRAGQTGCFAPAAPIPGGTSRTQAAGGFCSIPANARALTGNITTVQSGGGYLTLYPSDAAQPLVANSNYDPNEILNNVFTVGLGSGDGAFKIFVTSDTHVVVDVTGYYAPPAAGGLYFHPLPKPIRLLETRVGFSGCTTPGALLQGTVDTTQAAHLTCDGVTIPSTAKAIVGNATTVNPSGPGSPYMTLFPADAARPLAASSNYLPGQIMNAPFTVGLSAAGEFKIYPTTRTDLVIDVLGYYSADAVDANGAGLLFNPLPKPVRLLETRAGFSGCFATNTPLLSGSTRTQPARGVCDGVEIAANALGIVGNATVVNSGGGYLTFWPSSAAQPLVATSNFNPGQVFNRHFTVGLGAGDGAFKIFTQFQTDLVIDISGYFAP